MKFKKLMIVGLILLTILTIGSVSAGEDASLNETLTADDTLDENILGSSLENEVISNETYEPESNTTYNPIPYNFKEEPTFSAEFPATPSFKEQFPIRIDSLQSGNVTLSLNGNELETIEWLEDYNNYRFFYTSCQNYGWNNFTVKYSGNDNYLPKEITQSYFLNFTYSEPLVSETVVCGEDIWICVDNQLINDLKIEVNGKKLIAEYGKHVVNVYSFPSTVLNLGKNTVFIRYEGDEYLDSFELVKEIEVKPTFKILQSYSRFDGVGPTNTYLGSTNCKYLDDLKFSITLPETAGGTVGICSNAYLDDENKLHTTNLMNSTEVVDGFAKISYNGLPVGINSIMLYYYGNAGFNYNWLTVYVSPKFESTDILSVGEQGYLTIKTPSFLGGAVSLYEIINSTKELVKEVSVIGETKIPLPKSDEGHTYFAEYYSTSLYRDGEYGLGHDELKQSSFYQVPYVKDNKVYASHQFETFVIKDTNPDINITYNFKDYDIVATYNAKKITLDFPNKVCGNISVLFDGKILYDVQLTSHSYWTNEIRIPSSLEESKNYTININFESDVYDNFNITKQLHILTYNDYYLHYINSSTLNPILVDEVNLTSGENIITLDVTSPFILTNLFYSSSLNIYCDNNYAYSKSISKTVKNNGPLNLTLSDLNIKNPGSYRITIDYTTGYGTTINIANYTLTVNDDRISDEKSYSSVNVSDIEYVYGSSGEGIVTYDGAKEIIAEVIDHEEAIIDINEGVITVSNLKAGTYTLKVTTVPDENHKANETTATITVNKLGTIISAPKVSATYNVAKYLIVTLKDKNNNIISDKEVVVKVGTLKKTIHTDNKGQVTVLVSGLVPDVYTAKFSFAGDDSYTKSSSTAKVVVAKATPKLTTTVKKYKANVKTKKYYITLKNNRGAVLKNTKVFLKVKGKKYSAFTNKKGIATFKLTKLTKAGTYKATAGFAGDSYFNKVTRNINIVVKR